MSATVLTPAMAAFRSMGTTVTVVAPADELEHVTHRVRTLFEAWDVRFSRFRAESELTALNARAGTAQRVSAEMYDVVSASVAAARATGGLFDPLLGQRIVALGYDRTFTELPSDRADSPAAAYRGGAWRAIVLEPETRSVTLPAGGALDLGGIAKGMAVDAALAAVIAAGTAYAAIDAGGDLAVHGLPPDQVAWPVAVDGLGERTVTITRGGLATSSELRRRWRASGTERHHLIDPRTGDPAMTDVVQATVTAATCRQAEIAAKAVLLMGVTTAADFIERNDLAAMILTRRGAELRMGRWA